MRYGNQQIICNRPLDIEKVGLGTQGVLWSDASVFTSHSESGGNALMFILTEHALQLLNGQSFSNPVELLDSILEEVFEYGKKITSNPALRKTFVLNSLVGVDNAAWMIYAAENNITSFDDLIPEIYRPALSSHHKKVASIPLMAYSIPISEIEQAVKAGIFFHEDQDRTARYTGGDACQRYRKGFGYP